jgi:hypothetical protein
MRYLTIPVLFWCLLAGVVDAEPQDAQVIAPIQKFIDSFNQADARDVDEPPNPQARAATNPSTSVMSSTWRSDGSMMDRPGGAAARLRDAWIHSSSSFTLQMKPTNRIAPTRRTW